MGRKNFKTLIILLCGLIACKKDKPETTALTAFNAAGSVYIVCEGNFGSGNSSLYSYHPLQDSVFCDLNNTMSKAPLGDVFQRMVRIGNQYFHCINNSDRVVILNAGILSMAGIINIPKPRYILPINPTKAYVSSEYSKNVYVINPQTQQVTDTIKLPFQNTEGMCLCNSNALRE